MAGQDLGRLPEGFRWEETGFGLRLWVADCEVLEIAPRRSGWMITIHLQDPRGAHSEVAVPNLYRGASWACRWVHSRTHRLRELATAGEALPVGQ
jgi:hypothetical protein